MVGQMDIEPDVRLRLILRDDGTVELMKPRFTRTAAHAERWQRKVDRSE